MSDGLWIGHQCPRIKHSCHHLTIVLYNESKLGKAEKTCKTKNLKKNYGKKQTTGENSTRNNQGSYSKENLRKPRKKE